MKLKNIKLIIMDVDGTLTDGSITIDSQGNESKTFNVKDGMGIKLAQSKGIYTAILSSRNSRAVEIRGAELNIDIIKQGIVDKRDGFNEILKELKMEKYEAVFIGDDINDIEVCKESGFSFAVLDAVEELKKNVEYVLSLPGGKGAVREAIDLILKNK